MPTPAPSLGYGQRGEAPINSVNQWMRSQPWYQQLIRSFGQDPTSVHLTDDQKTAVIRAAQANGVVVDEGHNGQEVDDSGNFRAKSHTLRNTLIVAGIAGAALLTAGAAGAFGGAAVGGAEGGAAAAGAGTLAASATVPTVGGVAAGGAGLAGASAAAGGGAAVAGASAVPWSTIIGAGSSLFGNLFGAEQQASAADRAAAIAAAGNKYSADLLAKASADSLKFQYANAENAYQNNEASRQGNYGIFAARERRLGTIGEEVGLGAREIPAYVPGVDPRFGGGTSGETGGADPAIAAFIADYQQSHPVSEGIAPLAAAVAQKFPGVTRYMYGATPSDNELNIGGQKYKVLGGEHSPGAYWYTPGTNDGGGAVSTPARAAAPVTTATPFMSATLAPGVPQSIGYYA